VVNNAAVDLEKSLSALAKLAQTSAAESARGIMEIDKAKAAIQSALSQYVQPQFRGNTSADAEVNTPPPQFNPHFGSHLVCFCQAVVMAARKLASATGELVVGVGTSQDDLALACQATAQSVKLLLGNSKGGATTSPDRLVRERLLEAAQAAAESSVLLLESCKTGSKSKTLQAQAQVTFTFPYLRD